MDAKGIVYAFSRDTNRIIKFDSSGKFLGEWKHADSAGLAKGAHGLFIDSEGFFWLTDRDGYQVKKFSPDGTLVLTLGSGKWGATNDTFAGPTQTIELPDGNMLVADGYWNSRLVWYTKDGKFIKSVGSFGRGPGEFGPLHSVAVGPNGRIYVADLCRGNYPYPGLNEQLLNPNRKGTLDPGQYEKAGWTSNLGWRCEATNLKKDPNQKRVHVVDKNGRHIAFWPMTPLSVAARGDRIYVADEQRAAGIFHIRILDAMSGKELESFQDVAIGHALTVASNGDVYVAGLGGPRPLRRFARLTK